MTSISELLPRAAKLKYEVMLQLQLVESGKADASDCAMGLSELQRQLATLRSLLEREPASQRSLWKLKIDELRHEANFLEADLRGYQKAQSHARERDQLLHRRHASAANDNLEEEGSSLHRSGAQVDELMESGNATIKSLAQQRERLKATHRNMLSMINTLGISNSVMKLISSREKNDRYIFFAGVTITLVVLYLCIRFSRS
ncbi:soluble NSF attachment protein receptor [Pelagophyceae sp. CCMP2097]|nr:soluble NSF attachment protein receptor [Pelagophyceae sp. CCMP2097]